MVSGDRLPGNLIERKEPKLIVEYQLPYIGKITLYDESGNPAEKNIHGGYLARIEGEGIVGRFSSSEEDLRRKVSEAVLLHLIRKRKKLTDELAQIDSVFPSDTRSLHALSSGNWMEQYRQNKSDTQIKPRR